ncbi:hypothetical protein D3C71_1759040 [compost metagenome]
MRRILRRRPGTGRKRNPLPVQPQGIRVLQDSRHEILEEGWTIDIAMQHLGDILAVKDALLARDEIKDETGIALDAPSVLLAAFLLKLDPF